MTTRIVAVMSGRPSVLLAGEAGEIARLRKTEGGDIYILSSTSIIRTLLAADEVDRLIINLCPELAGGGARLFEDGVPLSWSLTDLTTSDSGSVYLVYDRKRA